MKNSQGESIEHNSDDVYKALTHYRVQVEAEGSIAVHY